MKTRRLPACWWCGTRTRCVVVHRRPVCWDCEFVIAHALEAQIARAYHERQTQSA